MSITYKPSKRLAILRTPSVLDNFTTEVRCLNRNESVIFVRNDIQAFFQQQRIVELGAGVQEELLKMISAAPNKNLLSGIDDSQMVALVRSRYCQSPADMERYVRNAKSSCESFVRQIKEDYEKSKQPVEPPKTE